MLTFNAQEAARADQIASNITETGKYIGTITRAEKLTSTKGTQGLGISFKSDDGSTADYLDLYTVNAQGEPLPSMKIVQALLGCLQLRSVQDGKIKCSKWNKEARNREEVVVDGYPDMMGKRIGLLLQKALETDQNGADRDRIQIFGVFQADTELTVSEILARKTTPETLTKMVQYLEAHQVRDNRKNKSTAPQSYAAPQQNSGGGFGDFSDDIPFANIGRGMASYVI